MFVADSSVVRAITYAELQLIHEPNPDGSGYSGVTWDAEKKTFYAKALKGRVSPYCATPADAARYAAAWWRSVYGDAWPAIYRARKIKACRCVLDKPGGGYRFLVVVARTPGLPELHRPGLWYLKGERTTAIRSRTPDYPTRAKALEDYRRWAARIFGDKAGLYLRSTAIPGAATSHKKKHAEDDDPL